MLFTVILLTCSINSVIRKLTSIQYFPVFKGFMGKIIMKLQNVTFIIHVIATNDVTI